MILCLLVHPVASQLHIPGLQVIKDVVVPSVGDSLEKADYK